VSPCLRLVEPVSNLSQRNVHLHARVSRRKWRLVQVSKDTYLARFSYLFVPLRIHHAYSPCYLPQMWSKPYISAILNATWVQDRNVQVGPGVQHKVSDGLNGHFESELPSTLKKQSLIQQAQQFGTKRSRRHLTSVMYRMSVSVKMVPCGHRSPHFYYCHVEQGLERYCGPSLLSLQQS
jgi:hypothetical protein